MKRSNLWCGVVSSCVLFLTAATVAPAQTVTTAALEDSAIPMSPALASFTDVPADHWAYSYIEKLHEQGYISGCRANPPKYCPERSLTRAEMAVFIVRGVHGADWSAANLTFEPVPIVSFVICRVKYEHDGSTYVPDVSHAAALIDWLRQAYPISSATFRLSMLDYGKGLPKCRSVNSKLKTLRNRDIANGTASSQTRFYGIWDDTALGGRTKACASSIGGAVASGPSGAPQLQDDWDKDGTYADWLGGHELGHTLGLLHPPFCGPTDFIDHNFVNPNGNISPAGAGDDAIFGFNIKDKTDYQGIYPPTWKDVMTYCDDKWISDQNYHRLMNYFQTSFDPGFSDPGLQNKTDRLLIVGTVDTLSGEVALQPFFVFPDAGEIEPRTPGDFAIVFRDATEPDKEDDLFAVRLFFYAPVPSLSSLSCHLFWPVVGAIGALGLKNRRIDDR